MENPTVVPVVRPVYTLDSIAAEPARLAVPATYVDGKTAVIVEKKPKKKGMSIWLILLLLIIITGVILYFAHPSFVLSRNPTTNEVYIDWGKLILWAIGIAIIVVLGLWLLKGVIGYEMSW
jgi:hypothetical protein